MGLDYYIDKSFLIPLLPLIGAIISGLLGARLLRGQSHWPVWIGVGISALLSVGLLVGIVHDAPLQGGAHGFWRGSTWFNWISAGRFHADAAALIDPLTAVMLGVVNVVGFFICVFSAGYMKGEEGYFRFFSFLGLFIFAMNCLVMGNNFIMLYLGWEGVGLCSYLLIGFYYQRPSAREAAKKAFIVNRIGDFGFGIGIMLCFLVFGNVSYFGSGPGTFTGVLDQAANPAGVIGMTPWKQSLVQWIPFCLMLGAFGKSAQFPLYVWLPDAMEGPTPVSALIHAATMVTAGVYMIARCSALFATSQAALILVAVIGAFTAIFAASIALRQFDLKKVFAYSTISQLGFMFVAVGVLAPVAGIFHLVTHAFFKALLFLASGVVMHAMMGELDMRKMSGLKAVLPRTRWLMLIGCCALAGVPFFSGFYSKDEIVAAAWHRHWLLGAVLLLTALMTAYYTFRLYFRVFEGPLVIPATVAGHGPAPASHADDEARASHAAVETGDVARSGVDSHVQSPARPHDTGHGHAGHGHAGHGHNPEPLIMIFPLVVLAAGAFAAGLVLAHGGRLEEFLRYSPSIAPLVHHAETTPAAEEAAGNAHMVFMIVSGAVAVVGIWLAYHFHLKNRAAGDDLPRRFPGINTALESKYWVDEIYQAAVVEPLRTLGLLFYWIDRAIVDSAVWFVGFVPQFSGFILKLTTQRGFLQGYAAAMLLGILLILLFVFL